MISTTDAKPRGYAFIEYEHERDMHCKLPLSHRASWCVCILFVETSVDYWGDEVAVTTAYAGETQVNDR